MYEYRLRSTHSKFESKNNCYDYEQTTKFSLFQN